MNDKIEDILEPQNHQIEENAEQLEPNSENGKINSRAANEKIAIDKFVQKSVPEFSAVMKEMAKPNPQRKILSDYLSGSVDVRLHNLNLAEFLSFQSESLLVERDVTLRRRSLFLILCAENLLRLGAGMKLDDGQQNEVLAVMEEMLTVGDNLRLAINEISGEHREGKSRALLYAASNLLPARLRLSSLVEKKKLKQEFHSNPAPEEVDSLTDKQTPPVGKPVQDKQSGDFSKREKISDEAKNTVRETRRDVARKISHKTNRWLIAATILVALIGGGIYAFTPAAGTTATVSRKAQNIELHTLRGGENLLTARLTNETLVGVINENWKNLGEEKKREQLQQVLGSGSQHHYKSVLFVNSQGDVIAKASAKEITIR